jgi:hypothetical protein
MPWSGIDAAPGDDRRRDFGATAMQAIIGA